MNKIIVICAVVCAVLLLTLPAPAIQAQEGGQYASVNGLEIYYETHGEGQPLMLLHGGLGGVVEFAQLIPALAESRQVIAVELQGHGHTADIDRPLTYEGMADDIAALIEYLGYDNVDLLGFSLGGGVALQTAIRHPEVIRKLMVISAPYSQSGIHPEFLGGMMAMNVEAADAMLETPMYQYYSSVAPDVEDWPTLVGKLGEMLSQDYDWSEDVATIAAPTLIVAGDSDEIPPAHVASMFELLGGGVPGDFVGLPNSQLATLPGTTHFTILTRVDLLAPIITAFLDAQLPETE